MGDAQAGPVRLSFNPQLRVEFHGATVTSDAGLLLPRELDERLGLSALIERPLTDPRTGPLPRAIGREPFDITPLWADPRAYRAARVASDLIERTGQASRETRSDSIPAGVFLRWGGHRWRAPEHAGSAGQEAREPPVIYSEWATCPVGGRAAPLLVAVAGKIQI